MALRCLTTHTRAVSTQIGQQIRRTAATTQTHATQATPLKAAAETAGTHSMAVKITKITRTFYNKVLEQRKQKMPWAEKGIFFIGADGNCYRTDKVGGGALRAVQEFKKKLEKPEKDQTSLFD
jgi:hypothetical protein